MKISLNSRIRDALWGAGWIIRFYAGLLPDEKKVDPDIRNQRLAICRECPIYSKRWGTCGLHKELDPYGVPMILGCGCWMRVKTWLAEATCWARDHKLNLGWPEHLYKHESGT